MDYKITLKSIKTKILKGNSIKEIDVSCRSKILDCKQFIFNDLYAAVVDMYRGSCHYYISLLYPLMLLHERIE